MKDIIVKIFILGLIGLLYFFFIGFTLALSEVCSFKFDCYFLVKAYQIGITFLIISFIALFAASFKFTSKKVVIFKPQFALPIYILMIFLGFQIDSGLEYKKAEDLIKQLPVSKITQYNGGEIKWTLYTDEKYGFSVEYPKKYEEIWVIDKYEPEFEKETGLVEKVTFSTYKEYQGWNVGVYNKGDGVNEKKLSMNDMIDKKFTECARYSNTCLNTRQEIKINDTYAELVFIEENRLPKIYAENDSYIYIIDSANGFLESSLYEMFYNSFNLTDT